MEYPGTIIYSSPSERTHARAGKTPGRNCRIVMTTQSLFKLAYRGQKEATYNASKR